MKITGLRKEQKEMMDQITAYMNKSAEGSRFGQWTRDDVAHVAIVHWFEELQTRSDWNGRPRLTIKESIEKARKMTDPKAIDGLSESVPRSAPHALAGV